jgi:integrase
MATVTHRAERGTWEVRWAFPQTRIDADGNEVRTWAWRRRSCPDKRTADALAREVETAAALGDTWTDGRAVPVATIGAVAEAWIRVTVEGRPAATARFRASVLQRFVTWAGDGRPVADLTGGLLRDYATALRAAGVKSVARYVGTAEQLWRWAHDNGDTFPGVPEPRRITGADRDVPHAPPPVAVDTPTWADVDRLLFALSPAGGEAWKRRTRAERDGGEVRGVGYRPAWEVYRRIVMVQRFAGLRVSQILALTDADLDLDRGRLTIRAGRAGAKGQARDRIVPMHPAMVAEVRGWGPLPAGLLFTRTATKGPRRGDRLPLTGREVAEVLTVAWERAEVRRSAWAAVEREHGRPTNAIRACWKSAVAGAASYDLAALMLGQSAGRADHDKYVALGNPDASPYWPAMVRALEAVPPVGEPIGRGLLMVGGAGR